MNSTSPLSLALPDPSRFGQQSNNKVEQELETPWHYDLLNKLSARSRVSILAGIKISVSSQNTDLHPQRNS